MTDFAVTTRISRWAVPSRDGFYKESTMKKKTHKLTLHRETVQNLHLPEVAGGISEETFCGGYTCYRLCRPVPSVDVC